jgi:hypothetical protein
MLLKRAIRQGSSVGLNLIRSRRDVLECLPGIMFCGITSPSDFVLELTLRVETMSQYFLDFVLGLIVITKVVSDWRVVGQGLVRRRKKFLITFVRWQEFFHVEHVMSSTTRR